MKSGLGLQAATGATGVVALFALFLKRFKGTAFMVTSGGSLKSGVLVQVAASEKLFMVIASMFWNVKLTGRQLL